MKKSVEESMTSISGSGDVSIVEYQPGNSTRYVVSFVKLNIGEKAADVVGCTSGDYLITILEGLRDRPSVILRTGGYLCPSYLEHKIGVGEGDSAVLVPLIGTFIGIGYDVL